MRGLIGALLAIGALACSGGSSDSTGSSGGTTTAASSTGTSTGGDTGGNASGGSSSGTSSGGIPVTGTPLGQLCDTTNHFCRDSQVCVTAMGAKQGFCTIECGMTPGTAKKPPDGGPQLCAAAQTEGGTAACDLTMKNTDGSLTWDCGLECGGSFGTCPTGLSCSSMNLCQ